MYSQHPLSAAFPSMTDDDFGALVEDIRQHGQRDPATLCDGMVIDGWHRYQACEELGIPCRFEEFNGVDAVAFVRSKNQYRRHYQKSQQAAIEVALTAWADSHRPKKGEAASPFSTNKEMAERAGTADRTIQHAKRAHEAGLGEAVRDGKISAERAAELAKTDPELAKKVGLGEISLPAALKQISHPKPAPESAPPDPRKNSRDRSDDIERLEEENAKLREEVIALEEQLSAAMDAAEAAAELSTTLERYEAIIGGEADKMIHDLQIMVERLKEDRRRIEVMRDEKMNENAQLIKEVKMLRRKLAKYEG